MNLLLFRRSELSSDQGQIRGDRAEHVRRILKKKVGDSIKAGVAGEGRGTAEIIEDRPDALTVRLGPLSPEPRPTTHLIVALPRPLAVSRLLHTAASFGVDHIDLIRAWKVPRSYLDSPRLQSERIDADLRLGAEQGAQVWVPTFQVHDGFRRFVEDDLPTSPALAESDGRFVLDLDARGQFPDGLAPSDRKSLVFGPEGGLIPEEVESFVRAGFSPVRLVRAILTTEIAIAASLAQLALIGERSRRTTKPC